MPKTTKDWIKSGWKAAMDADIDVLDPEFVNYVSEYLDDNLFCDIDEAESDVKILREAIDDALDVRDEGGTRLRDIIGNVEAVTKVQSILLKALKDTK